MAENKIESRRAFFGKLGKIVGMAALAVPFVVAGANAEATTPDEDSPATGCGIGNCTGGCYGSCRRSCQKGCQDICKGYY